MSSPFQRISPESTSSVGMSCRIAMAVTDLPEPDSPTTENTSPRWMSKDTPSTACTMPSPVSKWACRSRTDRSGSSWLVCLIVLLLPVGIEGVAQAVADEDERQHGLADGRAGAERSVELAFRLQSLMRLS